MKSFAQFLLLENPPAWHGSQHDHDGFTVQKIGTGEGNNVFGWGMYFSSSKAVAEWYRTTLAGKPYFKYGDKTIEEKLVMDILPDIPSDEEDYKRMQSYYDKELETKIASIFVQTADKNGNINERSRKKLLSIIQSLLDKESKSDEHFHKIGMSRLANRTTSKFKILYSMVEKFNVKKFKKINPGRLYHVDIIPEEDEFLDWNAALEKQSPQVKDKLKRLNVVQDLCKEREKIRDGLNKKFADVGKDSPLRKPYDGPSGEQIYMALAKSIGQYDSERSLGSIRNEAAYEKASKYLLAMGIVGIKYYGASSGEKNYVIFDDSHVKIKEKL